MAGYFFKRVLWLFPTWMSVSLVAFVLSSLAPGDPVQYFLDGQQAMDSRDNTSSRQWEIEYKRAASFLGLDQPLFYFSLQPIAFPDTLYRIQPATRKKAVKSWLLQSGDWQLISNFYHQLLQLHHAPLPANEDRYGKSSLWRRDLKRWLGEPDFKSISRQIQLWHQQAARDTFPPELQEEIRLCLEASSAVNQHKKWINVYLPSLHWYGLDNQFHRWLTGIFVGDMGRSYIDGRPVTEKIGEAIPWTLLLNGCALLLAVVIAIGAGVFMATHPNGWFDIGGSILLFLGYAIPTFWLGTLLLLFFATPDYGMKWFPTLGPAHFRYPEESLIEALGRVATHFTLPVLCLATGAIAYLSRQVRSSMLRVLPQEYIMAAKSRGLPTHQVLWKYAFRNALIPIITILASLFPAILAGSLVVEIIFNLYGMGTLAVQSVYARDWQTLFGIVQLGALLTLTGILLADIAYVLADPRIRFSKR